ncbi:MAG: T9SS type A sorting domain-containing protein [Bacteroidota bacterium]|nr:T9SS type A sorting domain-containing protein [Bacteroidota bacterium]
MLQIAGDSIVPPAYEAPTRWMLKQSLYQYLKNDPATLASHPMLTDFQSIQATSNIGKLDDVEQVLADPSNPAALLPAQSLNGSVTPANDAESNTKWMNEMLIQNSISGIDFTESQLADLRLVAAKCPYNDGMAVHQARTILSQYESAEYVNLCESFTDENRSMQSLPIEAKETENFRLYPNPNDGSMKLIYSMKDQSTGTVTIFDISGKAVASYSLETGTNNQILINETMLNSGVYFYKVIIDNEVKMSDKIVIIK